MGGEIKLVHHTSPETFPDVKAMKIPFSHSSEAPLMESLKI